MKGWCCRHRPFFIGIPTLGSSRKFSDIFRYLLELSVTRSFTLVIDEFQDFFRVNKSVFSELQEIIQRDYNTFSGLMLERWFHRVAMEGGEFTRIGRWWDRNRRTSERRDQAGLDYPEREGGKLRVSESRGSLLTMPSVSNLDRRSNAKRNGENEIDCVDFRRDSAKRASTMALAAPKIDMICEDELEDKAVFYEIKRQADEISIGVLKDKSEAMLRASGAFFGKRSGKAERKDYEIGYRGLSMEEM